MAETSRPAEGALYDDRSDESMDGSGHHFDREIPCDGFEGDGRFCESCGWVEPMHNAATFAAWRGWVAT